ncbi:MAG: choline/ethanolamine kinase family protein [Rhizobiaceae bacterium]
MTGVTERIRSLPLWRGPIVIAPLSGGLSNESFVVSDDAGRHVVRFGKDYPFHHVLREREVMTARAAEAAGFAPAVEHAGPGVMVSAFIDGRTFEAADVCAHGEAIAAMMARFHRDMPARVTGPGFMFWPFHVVRDYVHSLSAAGGTDADVLARALRQADALERQQVALPIVFGHNDLLPANFIHDGERLWLIDFEYAGFSTAMFDLAGIASNAGMSSGQADDLLGAYFGYAPGEALRRSHSAMQCASLLREALWGLVSRIHLAAPGVDYDAYAAENFTRLAASLDRHQTHFGRLDP